MNQQQTKTFANLIDVVTYFSDKEICKKYLADMRWNGSPVCPHCGNAGKIYTLKSGYKCGECRQPFSVTKGTIFENSPIPLQKWFTAIYIVTSHKKGISSMQLAKDLTITQKSAWFMLQRIRFALKQETFNTPSMSGTIEVDETYIGGKNKNRHTDKKIDGSQGRSALDKTPVFGMAQRNGRVTAMKISSTSKKAIQPIIEQHIATGSNIMSDEWKAYTGLNSKFNHAIVKHGDGVYVIGDAHTNTIEGFWSLLKRGIVGIYHSVSVKHLDLYVDEFEYRYNTREMAEAQRFQNMIQMSEKRLTYKTLIS